MIGGLGIEPVQFVAETHQQERGVIGELLPAHKAGNTLIGARLKLTEKREALNGIHDQLKTDQRMVWLSGIEPLCEDEPGGAIITLTSAASDGLSVFEGLRRSGPLLE